MARSERRGGRGQELGIILFKKQKEKEESVGKTDPSFRVGGAFRDSCHS